MDLDSAVFYSNDINAVIPFYRDTLGFKLESQSERFVSFIFPSGGRLGIKNKTEEREVPGNQTVFISTDEVQSLYEALSGKKDVVIYKEPREWPWGKEFSILDPDSNKVLFIQRTI
ncbi:MAG: VOC family protein [bacterium]|nr:VOC family protein [bacterium]